MNKKNTGSYYTPDYLANFVTYRVLAHFEDRKTNFQILEPSVGDGSFIKAIEKIENLKSKGRLTAIEKNGDELAKAKKISESLKSEFIEQDFLEYDSEKRFSVILGNPPYIKKNFLTPAQLKKCKEIHLAEELTEKSVKNLWASFLVKSNRLLESDGVLAFVLPSELLQVKFAEEIRAFLQREFQRLEIFTFNELMFECKGQDTVVLFAYKKSSNKGIFYSNIESESQLKKSEFTLKKNEPLTNAKVKWTHHFLTSDEITFLEKLKSKLKTVSEYCNSKPGIVTAANNYFIVNEETETNYELSEYTSPIIQKGFYVNGSVVFDKNDYEELIKSKTPSKLLVFKDEDKENFSEKVSEYLKIGVEQELPERYKCKLRDNWFVIPNISHEPEGFFFKRCHHYPKILKNEANVFVTDSAYKIEIEEGFDINSFIYSFYNSLTLAFAELEGRYYGGGVLELTPSEFKKLPIPYSSITEKRFKIYRRRFENKKKIESILKIYDSQIFKKTLNLNIEEIAKIKKIRQKLIDKRFRKESKS